MTTNNETEAVYAVYLTMAERNWIRACMNAAIRAGMHQNDEAHTKAIIEKISSSI